MHGIALLLFAASLSFGAWSVSEDLIEAARTGDLAAFQTLIAKGAALDTKTAYGQTPLYLAAMNGREDVVRVLPEKGVNPDVHGSFYKASMLDFVLQENPDEVLASVAAIGNADLIEALPEAGKPSQPALDKTYETALGQKQTEAAALLKKAGAREPAPAAGRRQLSFQKGGDLMNRHRTAGWRLGRVTKQSVDRRKRRSHPVPQGLALLWGRRFRLPTDFFTVVCRRTLALIATAADWPQSRGPSASGVGSGSKPPIHWDAAKGTNVVRKAEIPGLSLSSPIVWVGGSPVLYKNSVIVLCDRQKDSFIAAFDLFAIAEKGR